MNRKDHILILSSGLLSLPAHKTLPLLESFSHYYVYDEPAKPGFVSIAGDMEGRQRSLIQWVQDLQEEGITGTAFEGTDEYIVRVTTSHTRRSYVLNTILSPDSPTDYSWELYYFEAVDTPGGGDTPDGGFTPGGAAAPISTLKAVFQSELVKTAAFAAGIRSPMEEAFRLANYFLDTPAFSPLLDEAHLEAILHDLEEKGFSEQALENTRNIYDTSSPFCQEGWTAQRIYGLFAVDLSDVFDGPESWNDLLPESDEDYATHRALCGSLFTAMRAYLGGLLSFSR